jgi:hypothetical protein
MDVKQPLPVPERAGRYLAKMDPAIAGSGGHDATFKAATVLLHGFALDQPGALALLRSWNNTHCQPPWTEHELQHKIRSAAGSPPRGKQRGWLLGNVTINTSTATHIHKVRPTWPSRDYRKILEIGREGFGVADLYHDSPIWPEEMTAEDFVDELFPGNPILCVGDRVNTAVTDHREKLRGTMTRRQFIVPSAMKALKGKTRDGRGSARCLENTGTRRFIVIECDFAPGRDSEEDELLKDLAAIEITIADLSAAIIARLAEVAPLVMAVWSGSKSVHGWFAVRGQTEHQLKKFTRYAVSIGGDHATWTLCQFVRMPQGTRDTGTSQVVYYWSPQLIGGRP